MVSAARSLRAIELVLVNDTEANAPVKDGDPSVVRHCLFTLNDMAVSSGRGRATLNPDAWALDL